LAGKILTHQFGVPVALIHQVAAMEAQIKNLSRQLKDNQADLETHKKSQRESQAILTAAQSEARLLPGLQASLQDAQAKIVQLQQAAAADLACATKTCALVAGAMIPVLESVRDSDGCSVSTRVQDALQRLGGLVIKLQAEAREARAASDARNQDLAALEDAARLFYSLPSRIFIAFVFADNH
jgi:hypothetical protein